MINSANIEREYIMGQYYTPIIIRGNSKQSFYSHNYDNGLKLMEHSYIGNTFVETVLRQIFENKARLAWVGDYAEPEDVEQDKELVEKFIEVERTESDKKYRRKPEPVGKFENSMYLIFINHTKKQYLVINEYLAKNNVMDKWGMIAHPIPLLTAIGNGKGGGDYRGSNMEDIGIWACDVIEANYEAPKDYTNITSEIRFVEGEE